jgi:hypothetical protein
MRVRYVLLTVLVLGLSTGCTSIFNGDNSDSKLSKLKKEACDSWYSRDTKIDKYMSYLTAIKFQEIAELDAKYDELSISAFSLFQLNSTSSLADTVKPILLKSSAELMRHCSSNNFTGFTPSP